mmetsp:Transcript_14801/g.19665  ORF Transcript_14801/g.19665 Transcript_14801/m.19665 type:complete len:516 (+) Transcript_14801:53-1600(+)
MELPERKVEEEEEEKTITKKVPEEGSYLLSDQKEITFAGRERGIQSVRRKWRKKLLYLAAYSRLLERESERPKGWKEGSKLLLIGSQLNVLLIFLFVLPFVLASKVWTFTISSLILLPLAALLGEVTEKVAYHTSETIGGLLNATFGNATEALVSIFALKKGLLTVVQVSLIGSVLSNMLLVLGSAFIAAGIRNKLATFNRHAATANTGLLLIAVLALLIPAMLTANAEITLKGRQALSRLTSCMMLFVYVVYLNFQLSSHSTIFVETEIDIENTQETASSQPRPANFADVVLLALDAGRRFITSEEKQADIETTVSPTSKSKSPTNKDLARSLHQFTRHKEKSHDDEYVLQLDVALLWLAIITIIIAILSEFLTGSLEGFAESLKIPDAFVGFVLLPIVGNAAEHATAISMAYRSKMDLAVAVALGSATQIALFVLPLMVLIGWIINQPLDLAFGTFQTAMTALSVIIVNSIAQQGEIHYLNGLCLVVAYIIISASFLYLSTGKIPTEDLPPPS